MIGSAHPTLPRIALERVNVHLAGRHVLHDVSWSLGAGEHWAIVGPNGSGKSTLLRVIAGTQWIDHDDGRRAYSRDGRAHEVVGRAAGWIRHVTAEQHERFARLDLPLTGRELIAGGFADSVYPPATASLTQTQRIDALVARLGLEEFAARPMREMSSGQLRRVLIARALASDPLVLVLDEFTNGLDRTARHEILDLLESMRASVALIIASHRSDDFPAAITHTARVDRGRVTLHAGPPAAQDTRSAEVRVGTAPAEGGPVLVAFAHADVYRGDTLVLRDVTWQLRRGEHTAIRGANGAGKTTFARFVAGTLPAATGGDVVRFGAHGPFDIWQLKERVAYVSDDLQIAYDRGETVEAVVASGFTSSIGLFREPTVQQRAAVADIISRIGLDGLRGRTFTQLSFGERRKVLIARSLVRRPAIFILDEIWNGLDRDFRAAFRAVLTEMTAAGTTLVAIAHDDDDELLALTVRACTVIDGTVRE